MKYLIINFILATVFFSCSSKNENPKTICTEEDQFKICCDTTFLDFDGFLTRIISVDKNKIYSVLIKEIEGEFEKEYLSHLLIFEKSGNILSNTPLPPDFNEQIYYNLKIQNDSLILIDDEHKIPFYFDESLKIWNRLEKFIPIVYQDEKYQISSVCYGEFGGLAYFQNKKTSQVYETDATCLKSVNKIGGSYYLTNKIDWMGDSYVVKIYDPDILPIAQKPLKLQSNFDNSVQTIANGSEVILDLMQLTINYSFIYNDSLYHVLKGSQGITFEKSKNGKMFKINTPLNIVNTHFQQQISGNNIVCDFYENNGKCGLIFYQNDGLSLLYILKKRKYNKRL